MKKRIAITASQLISRLLSRFLSRPQKESDNLYNDPKYLAMRAARDRKRAEAQAAQRLAEKPILDELASIGVRVDSVFDLQSIPEPDERIYPILIDHFTRPYSDWTLEWMASAFGNKDAREVVWDTLLALLQDSKLKVPVREGLLRSVSELAKPKDLPQLIELITDQSQGEGRLFLVSNLMRSKRPEARSTLVALRDDPDLTKAITVRLKRARSKRQQTK